MCGNLRFGARWTGKGLRRAPPWSEGGAFSWSSEKSGRRRLRFDLPSVTPPGPSQMDKTLQRKYLALMSAITPAKVYCCLFIIAVLTTSVIVLSIVLSEFPEKIQSPSNHWIGLRRESSHHIWKWMDNTEYNNTHVLRLLIFLLCLYMVMCVSCVYEIRNVV
nr:C-type lectin domain family 2 member D-like isoform X1 [Macaca nemestrina]XP_011771065.1 C-type lectin domain family 2 member D-like isoform X1 [Macaca nemestrina]